MSVLINTNKVSTRLPSESSWVILSAVENEIKRKVEAAGTPLKNWNINIYRGVLTGYNEAFIIDESTRSRLVAQSPKSNEIIQPILRGRDIQKFHANWSNMYLIVTHNGYIDDSGNYINPIEVNNYESVKNHLDVYRDKLRARHDKGVTEYNLRSCIYMEDFFRPKIIYPEITKFINFYFDSDQHYYVNNKCFILIGKQIEYLTAFLNSSLFKFCFLNNFPELLGGTRELRKIFMETIPIKQVSEETNARFATLIHSVQKLKKEHVETLHLEKEIDRMIFDLYDLNEEEIETIGYIEIQ